MVTPSRIRTASLLWLLSCGSAIAADVFTWKDDNGIVHFSQWAPDEVVDIRKLTVHSTNPPDYEPDDDPYSIRNQAARTSETWQDLRERKEMRLKEQRENSERNYPYDQSQNDFYAANRYYSSPGYYLPPFYRPIRPPMRPPIHRPQPYPQHPSHVRPAYPHRPSAAPVTFSPDPMRSAHIGVRRSSVSRSSAGIE